MSYSNPSSLMNDDVLLLSELANGLFKDINRWTICQRKLENMMLIMQARNYIPKTYDAYGIMV